MKKLVSVGELSGHSSITTSSTLCTCILGMSILPNGNFNPDEIMPICLPSSKNYEDSKRGAFYVYHCYLRGASKKLKHYQLFGTIHPSRPYSSRD